MNKVKSIARLFRISGDIRTIIPWGGGHINKTYKVECDSGTSYILQKINTEVFLHPQELMENVERVSKHIIEDQKIEDLVVPLISSTSDKSWIQHDSGFWRMYPFIDDRVSYELAINEDICEKAGRSYGAFLVALHDFPVDELHTIIPNFHNIRFRVIQFYEALKMGNDDRINRAVLEIKSIEDQAPYFIELYETALLEQPIRVTHNDTKLNNVLIGNDELGTVIDLDTVMPGFTFFDVGDGLRSMAISSKEDDSDYESIKINIPRMNAFLEGYLSNTKEILTQSEIELLPKSGAYMAFIMAVRFLTDYLLEDIYYKTEYEEHNLIRARNQLKVCALFSNKGA